MKELINKLDDMFTAAIDHPVWKDFAKNAAQDFRFREGEQWTAKEIKELNDRGQPVITENEIKPVIDRLIGQYKKQKTRIIYRGRNLGPDEAQGNLISDLMLYVQQNTGYEFEEGDMFDDGACCGFGVLETFVEFDESLQPVIRIRHEDSLNIYPDPNSRRYDWNEDAAYICRAKWIDIDEAKELYPAKAKELEKYVNTDPVNDERTSLKKEHYVDEKLKRIRPVEVWYKEKSLRKIAFTQEGPVDISDLSKKDEKQLRKSGINVLQQIQNKMKMAVFCGDIILEEKDSPYDHNLFTFVPYFVYRRKNGEPYSIVRLLIDPQTEINKRRSKALHLLNTNQAVFEEGAIDDTNETKKEIAKPDGMVSFRKGYAFELVKNVELANSQMGLLQESKSAVGRISGINDESRGLRSEVRSGVGLQRKQMMTDVIITPVFDNLRRTRLILGRICFQLMRQYFNEEKVFTVTDDMNRAKQIPLTGNDIAQMKDLDVDIVIEEAPDTTTMQDEQFRLIAETLQAMNLPPNLSMFFFPLLVRLSQIREKDAILKQFEAASQPKPEMPKMSMNFQWVEMTPEEKAWAAQNLMQAPELAQIEMQAGGDPAHITKAKEEITKTGMKVQGDMEKERIKAGSQSEKNRGDMAREVIKASAQRDKNRASKDT